jgi:membrane protein YdbS with pleckstrin-like domain
MQTKTFKPSPRYLTKFRLSLTIVAGLIFIGGFVLGMLMSFDRDVNIGGGMLAIVIITGLDAVWWVPGMLLTGPYYNSLSYEIQDDEVIMRVGIWTKSVKHVPYRTVTNITVKRGILDRLFGLGTLNIQTAGMSGTTGAEESLEGLENVQEVYDMVAAELRRFRGSMAPTAADAEGEPVSAPSDALSAILTEVRAIRQALEGQVA